MSPERPESTSSTPAVSSRFEAPPSPVRADREGVSGGFAGAPGTDGLPLPSHFSCRSQELESLFDLLRATLRTRVARAPGTPPSARESVELDEVEDAGEARPIALVRGACGMGKSRLLAALRERAEGSEILVREIFCHVRQGVPLLPILRLVKDLLRESADPQRLWRGVAQVLGRVLPEVRAQLGTPSPDTELAGEHGKTRLFDALLQILTRVSQERPILVLIHDLHRSDAGTVEFLEYLGRNLFLDAALGRRESVVRSPGGLGEDWKQIRRREEGPRRFVSDALGEPSRPPAAAEPHRVLFVANYLDLHRGEGAPPESEVAALLDELEAEPYVRHLTLGPLDATETAELLEQTLRGRQLPAPLVERLHAETGGNPLHLIEVCRSLYERGALPRELSPVSGGAAPIDIPESAVDELFETPTADAVPECEDASEQSAVADSAPGVRGADSPPTVTGRLAERRLAAVDALQKRVLRALAVIRRPVQLAVLASVVQAEESVVERAVDQLVAREFLRVRVSGATRRFLLVHEDYIRAADPGDTESRGELHLRIGRTLAAHGRAAEPVRTYEIYEHFRHSPEPRESIHYGLRALDYFAGAFAVDLAARIGTELLELLTGDEDLATRLRVLGQLGRLELHRGNFPVAKGHVKRLLEEGETLAPTERLDAYLLLAEIYSGGAEPHKGIKVLHRALKQCADAIDDTRRAEVAARLSRLRLERKDSKRAINVASAALKELAPGATTDAARVRLLEVLADAHLARADAVSAIQTLQQRLEILEGSGDGRATATVLQRLGRVYYDRGNYFRAARYLFRALDVIRRLQDLPALCRTYEMLGKVYRNSGDNLRGIEYFHRCLQLRERIGDREGLSPTLNSIGSLYAHTGDYMRAIRYFQHSVENSERFGDTQGIVRAFLHLGRAYFEIGELRQVESLAKQILILSQEFDLTELEGEGHRLQGDLLLQRGDLRRAEREYRRALEIASKSGRKNSEAAATLALGALLNEKEDFEGALKLISKGQLLAEEIQSVPLQVRAYLLKGNVYRFLKGGNVDRAKECFRKGLELVSGDNHLPLSWALDYSISKVFQGNLEFAEAAESYRRAERILERIIERLPEDMRVTFTDDRRRKTFYDDYRRFKRDASGRTGAPAADAGGGPRAERVWRLPERAVPEEAERPDTADRLLEGLERLTAANTPCEWGDQVLAAARRLTPATGGFVALVTGEQPRVLASCDLGPEEEWANGDGLPGVLAVEAACERQSIRSGGPHWSQRLETHPGGASYRNRSLMLASSPLSDGRATLVIYLERPSAQNPFHADDASLLERFLRLAVVAFEPLYRLHSLVTHGGTTVLSPAGLDEILPDLVAGVCRDERSIALLEVHAPGLEADLGPEGVGRVAAFDERAFACARTGVDTFVFVYCDEAVADLSEIGSRLSDRFTECFLERGIEDTRSVTVSTLRPDGAGTLPEELLRELSARICRRRAEFDVETEIEQLTRGEFTLKEAKTALEKRYITAELLKSRGNITRAAESLGVHRPQLSNLIKKHRVRREEFE